MSRAMSDVQTRPLFIYRAQYLAIQPLWPVDVPLERFVDTAPFYGTIFPKNNKSVNKYFQAKLTN